MQDCLKISQSYNLGRMSYKYQHNVVATENL